MNDFSSRPLPEAGALVIALPGHGPIARPEASHDVEVEQGEASLEEGLTFDELLLNDLVLNTQDETLSPEAIDTLQPESLEADTSALAQQFLASLTNSDVATLLVPASEPVKSGPALQLTPLAAAPPQQMPRREESALPLREKGSAPANLGQQEVTPPAAEDAEPLAMRKSTLPVELESLRPVVLKPLNVSTNTFATGESAAAKVNAPLVLPKGGEMLGAQLQQALGERLSVQVNNHIQHATIRLDPPEMGRIEIAIQVEAGKIQVQITAGQNDVYRALQQVSNELRQALTEQHYVEADVQIFSQQPGQQPHQGKPHPSGTAKETILANEQPDDTHGAHKRDDNTILMTV